VIHNPAHPETRKNLAFLDIAAGYFTRLEFATEGSLQSSLLAEFAHIARQYVQDCQNGKAPNLQTKVHQVPDTSDGGSAETLSATHTTIVSIYLFPVGNNKRNCFSTKISQTGIFCDHFSHARASFERTTSICVQR
jgi:hypothetical protein